MSFVRLALASIVLVACGAFGAASEAPDGGGSTEP
jgi:hypothetical protein